MERHQANPDAPVQCPRCDKTYPTRRYMLRHFRIMHAADREDNKRKSAKPKKTATEMFDCEIDECDRKFSSVSRYGIDSKVLDRCSYVMLSLSMSIFPLE